MKRLSFLVILLCLVCTASLSAKESSFRIYKGVRPMGMGGAFVAISNDANALFYNPAGLADIREKRISIFPLEVEFGQNAYDIYSDALDVDFDNEEETAEFLRSYIGDYAHAGVNFVPSYSKPNFALALIGTFNSNLQARNLQSPRLIVETVTDAGVATGYALSFLDDNLLVGASAKYIFRRSLDEEYTVLDITTEDFEDRLDDDTEDGSGALLDIGLIYKFSDIQIGEKTSAFQIGISANNFVDNDMGDAQDIDEHIDLGLAATLDKWTFALDYVDLFNQVGDDEDMGKRLRLGAEWAVKPFLFLRLGLYQGYPTFGVGLETKNVQFDVLTYAEEVGTYSGQRDDRRYMMRLGLGF